MEDNNMTLNGGFFGFIWDIDGVVVDCPHEMAWRETAESEDWKLVGFTSELYLHHVASKPRGDGGRSILERLGGFEKYGAATEETRRNLTDRFCAQKDARIKDLIAHGQFNVFGDAVRLLLAAKSKGMIQVAASASRNANSMLRKIPLRNAQISTTGSHDAGSGYETLSAVFDLNVCGIKVAGGKEGLLSLAVQEAQRQYPSRRHFVVFEDGVAGIEAARKLGMFVVGVNRLGAADALRRAGADIIVADLAELACEELMQQYSKQEGGSHVG